MRDAFAICAVGASKAGLAGPMPSCLGMRPKLAILRRQTRGLDEQGSRADRLRL
jgi:hypothetical protein